MKQSIFALKKSDAELFKFLVENPNKKFTQLEIAKSIKKEKSYKNVRETIQSLIKNNILIAEKIGSSTLCSLNLKEQKTIDYITFIESSKKYAFYSTHPKIQEICERLICQIELHTQFFIMLIFGSYVKGTAHEKSDIDIIIITDKKNMGNINKEISSTQAIYTEKINAMLMTDEDYKQMLSSKEEINVGKESLKHHIIAYSPELYYQIIKGVN